MADRSLPSFSDSRRATGKTPLPCPALPKDSKAKIFGLNAARLFQLDLEAKRKDFPKDYLSKIKMAYLEKGPTPTHHAYGWIRK
jgi:hypothetical protein